MMRLSEKTLRTSCVDKKVTICSDSVDLMSGPWHFTTFLGNGREWRLGGGG